MPGCTSADPVRVHSPPRNSGEFSCARTCDWSSSSASYPNLPRELGLVVEVCELVLLYRHDQIAGRLVFGVDLHALDVGGQRIVVALAEPFDLRELVRKPGHPVAEPVGQRRLQEAAVSPARAGAAARRLEQRYGAVRLLLLGVQRRPQPGIAAADDAQVRVRDAVERRMRIAARQRVGPERPRHGVGKG